MGKDTSTQIQGPTARSGGQHRVPSDGAREREFAGGPRGKERLDVAYGAALTVS